MHSAMMGRNLTLEGFSNADFCSTGWLHWVGQPNCVDAVDAPPLERRITKAELELAGQRDWVEEAAKEEECERCEGPCWCA